MRKHTKIGMKVALFTGYRESPSLKRAIDRLNAAEATVLSEPNSAGYVEVEWTKYDGTTHAEWLPPNHILATWEDYETACGDKLRERREELAKQKADQLAQEKRVAAIQKKLVAKGIKANGYGSTFYLDFDQIEKLLGIKRKA